MSGTITQCTTTSFQVELLTGTHDFTLTTGDVFNIALLKATLTGNYGPSTTNYSDVTGNSDEATGTGYTAGGATLTNVTPTSGGTTAYTDFADAAWAASTISSSGALIYNTSNSNKAVALLAFGSTITSTASTFTVTFPAANQTTAIIRIGS